ncbi:MAG: 16S rRNA (uracil(1498)-N(3))-methyltransferase [Clostridia bacterium]|nr:16S rRNA (uracil(1498)-N(3))-methyltransferase [Clostridia bacterium]
MPKFFVKNEQVNDEKINIIGQDVNHIKTVLRSKIGDSIEICNSDFQENFLCKIEKIEKEKIECKIIEKIEIKTESNVQVTIFQGIPKFDKMEYIIQKSVELGVYNIVPTEMKRCIVKITDKDKTKKQERWQKISEVAAKQCGRDIVPKVEDIINIKEISNSINDYDLFLVAYENEEKNKLKSELKKIDTNKNNIKIGLLIGPEGGLEENDVIKLKENGAKIITLGKRILRTETVALNVLSIIMYEIEK